jgi:transposase-like protein
MKQYIPIDCPYCQHDDLVKNGQSENGTQRYRCHACKRSLQWEYTSSAWLPGTKEQIEAQPLNGSGVRDISRTLGIAKNTVMSALKKNACRGQPGIRRTPEGEAIDQARRGYLCGSG